MTRLISFFLISIFLTSTQLHAQKRDTNTLVVRSSYTVDSLKISDLYLQGIREMSVNGNNTNAASIFNEILNINPNHAPSLYYLAYLSRNADYAYEMIEKAIAADPKNEDYKYLRAVALRRSGNVQATIEAYKEILKSGNKRLDLHLMLTEVYDQSQMPYAAINALDSAYTLFGPQPEIVAYQQNLYQRLN
ncbi:MAG: hypothetical protein RR388_02690, partial [Rikenellaceae bacterium]